MKIMRLFLIIMLLLTFLVSCDEQGKSDSTVSSATEETSSPDVTDGHVHSWSEWLVVKPATCTEEGALMRACSCGEIETKIAGKTAHVEGEWIVDVKATPKGDGKRHMSCTVCEEVLKEEVLAFSYSKNLLYKADPFNGTCVITGIGTCTDTDVYIPARIMGLNVVGIGDKAFEKCENIEAIYIPDGVTSIGEYAFWDCTNLKTLSIPESVVSLGHGMIGGCEKLEINIYENAKYLGNEENPYFILYRSVSDDITSCIVNVNTGVIYKDAFKDCEKLVSIVIPDSVTVMGESVFEGCSRLTSAVIGNGMTYIPVGAFMKCSRLESITIGSSVEEIRDKAFWMCESLKDFVLPDKVTAIGQEAFFSCKKLTSMDLSNVTVVKSYAFGSCTSLTDVTLSPGLKTMGTGAFGSCSKLTSVTIPDGVKEISIRAFEYCNGFTDITIPKSVTVIKDSAFLYCGELNDITFKGTMAEWNNIHKYSFWDSNTGSYTIHCTDGDITK